MGLLTFALDVRLDAAPGDGREPDALGGASAPGPRGRVSLRGPPGGGHGPSLFSGLRPSLRLKLVTAERLESGVVALHGAAEALAGCRNAEAVLPGRQPPAMRYARAMFRRATLFCSLAAVVIGAVYSEQRGLILDVTAAGEAIYSSSLQSSGADDAFLVRIAFASFIVSAAGSLLAGWRARAAGALKWVYGANVAFFVFVMWLVNLDVSVFRSVRHGDHLLAAGWVIVAIPLLFLAKSAWVGPRTTSRTSPPT